MTITTADRTISALLDPLDGLACLPSFWKEICRPRALMRRAAEKRRYVDEQLKMLHRHVEPLTMSAGSGEPEPLAAWYASVGKARSFDELAVCLGLNPTQLSPDVQFFVWAIKTQSAPRICLYAAAAQLAWPMLSEEYAENFRGVLWYLAAQSLHRLGRSDAAAVLLESSLGLSDADYAHDRRIRVAIAGAPSLKDMNADNRALTLCVLADALRFVQSRGNQHAARLLESYVGLEPADYGDSQRTLSAVAAKPLRDLHPINRAKFLEVLAEALGFLPSHGHGHAVLLLESYLGLGPADYVDGEHMRVALAASPRLGEPEASSLANLLRVLAESLRFVAGRGPAHGAVLLESYLGLDEADYADVQRMRKTLAVSQRFAGLEPNNRANLLRGLADSLSSAAGRGPAQAVLLLESYLGLGPADYAEGRQMRRTLEISPQLMELEVNNRAALLHVLAEALGLTPGRGPGQAVLLLESHIGLAPADYSNRQQMEKKLAEAQGLNGLEPTNRGKLLTLLADILGLVAGRGYTQAVLLLETCFGLDPADYVDGQHLQDKLPKAGPLAELDVNNRVTLLLVLANAWGFVSGRGHAPAALLLETYLGLSAADFADDGRMRAALASSSGLGELEANTRAALLNVLAATLGFLADRGSVHAARLLESYLGLTAVDPADVRPTWAALNSPRWRELDANSQARLLTTLATVWGFVPGRGRVQGAELLERYLGVETIDDAEKRKEEVLKSPRLLVLQANMRAALLRVLADDWRLVPGRGDEQAASLLESYLGLNSPDSEVGDRSQATLPACSELKEIEPNNLATLLQVLTLAWASLPNRGARQAASLLESYLGIEPLDYADSDLMQATLDASPRLAGLATNNRAMLLRCLAVALLLPPHQRPVHAAVLLESYLGLSKADYADGDLMRSRLASAPRLSELTANNRAMFLSTLANALGFVPDRGRGLAVRLLGSYLGVPMSSFPSASPLCGVEPLNILSYVHAWLRSTDGANDAAFPACRTAVAYIRELREEVLPTYRHRVEFLVEARKIWGQLQRIALQKIAHERQLGVEDGANCLLQELLWWAEQFHNRLLIERLFIESDLGGDDDGADLRGWMPSRPPLLPAEGPEDNPPDRQQLATSLCLGEQSPSPGVSHWYQEPAMREEARELRRRVLAPEGREPQLHELVPLGAVWVRALFDQQGRLRWWAWHGCGDMLSLLAEGVSSPNAERELTTANLRFDLEVERIWAAHDGQLVFDLEDERLVDDLIRVASANGKRRDLLADGNRRPTFQRELEILFNRLQCDHVAPALGRLMEKLTHAVLAEEVTIEPWMIEDLREGLKMFLQPWGILDTTQREAQREQRRRDALDDASRRHLTAVARHLTIAELWPKLEPEQWAKTDMVFQVPGPLLAAPLAWLPFGRFADGRAATMLESVASTSSVISLTLRRLAEQEAIRALPRRILTLRCENTGQRTRATWMSRLQFEIVSAGCHRDWEVWCLGDQLEATATNLRAALNDSTKPFGLLVVNAHGIFGTYGVKLAQDSEWRGSGADLRDTDLVILSACSVGRLGLNADRDVEGLCAELAAHHGRCVLAARWPIADDETATLTSEFVREYLDGADDYARADAPLPSFIRARTLNQVRRRLLEKELITFHLAAAFDIYGLG